MSLPAMAVEASSESLTCSAGLALVAAEDWAVIPIKYDEFFDQRQLDHSTSAKQLHSAEKLWDNEAYESKIFCRSCPR